MPPRKPRKRRSTSSRRSAPARSRMWPWYLAGLIAVGAIAARENLPAITSLLNSDGAGRPREEATTRPRPQSQAQAPERARAAAQAQAQAQARAPAEAPARAPRDTPAPTPDQRPSEQLSPAAAGGNAFFYCGIRQDNCVVDGGNFIYRGAEIRLADIYVPATKDAKCDRERNLGGDAKEALRVLLNAGRFELTAWKPIAEDQHGRKLRIVVRDGKSIGDTLVAKGLARPWSGQREPWCP